MPPTNDSTNQYLSRPSEQYLPENSVIRLLFESAALTWEIMASREPEALSNVFWCLKILWMVNQAKIRNREVLSFSSGLTALSPDYLRKTFFQSTEHPVELPSCAQQQIPKPFSRTVWDPIQMICLVFNWKPSLAQNAHAKSTQNTFACAEPTPPVCVLAPLPIIPSLS